MNQEQISNVSRLIRTGVESNMELALNVTIGLGDNEDLIWTEFQIDTQQLINDLDSAIAETDIMLAKLNPEP